MNKSLAGVLSLMSTYSSCIFHICDLSLICDLYHFFSAAKDICESGLTVDGKTNKHTIYPRVSTTALVHTTHSCIENIPSVCHDQAISLIDDSYCMVHYSVHPKED